MKKRCLAALLALVMIFSILPVSVFAVDAGELDGSIEFDDASAAANATGVTATKTLSGPDEDGNYTITLSVKGTTSTSSTTNSLPADIVLVVDTSTSMDEEVDRRTCGGEIQEKTGFFGVTYYECVECQETYWNYQETCTAQVKVNRLDVAKAAATQFVSNMLEKSNDIRFGLYDFSGSNRTKVGLTSDKNELLTAINNLSMPRWGDGTDYDVGLNGAAAILQNSEEGREKFIVFISDGDPKTGNGISVADSLKQQGITIFSVGIDVKKSGRNALQAICSIKENGNYYYYDASSDGSSGNLLSEVLAEIQKVIESTIHAAKNAVMTDLINSASFELVPDSASEGLQVSGNQLTWEIGDITKDTQTVSFKIKLKEDNTATGKVYTNSDVYLTFESTALGKEVKFKKEAIGEPTVQVNKVTYTDGLEETVFADEVYYNYILGSDIPPFSTTAVPVPYGYEFAGWNRSDDSDGNITFTAVYEPDTNQTKDLSYTVEYYKDGVLADTDTVTATVWVNDPDTLTVDSSKINTSNKYTGYKFDRTDPATVPATINDKGVIKVYYVKDASQTKTLSYTVEYYKDGVLADTDTVTATVWVNDPDTLTVDSSKINTSNKYTGYKFDRTDPATVPATINDKGVIKVYYVKDASQTKTLSYTVEYYKDGVLAATDTETATVWVNNPDTLTVNKSKINTTDKFYGYEFEKTVPAEIPTSVVTGAVIKVFYKASNASLTVTKTVLNNNKKYIEVGDTIEYRITIENTGNVTLSNVELNDVVRDEYGKKVAALRLYDKDGKEWTKISEIRPGTKIILYTSYKVTLSDLGKTLTNTVTALDPNNNGGGASSESIKVVSTLIAILPTLNTTDHVAYIIGYEDGTVKPNNNITRAEVATIFFRLLTDESRAYYWSQTNDYSDVSADDWFNNAVSTMANAGIITGYPDGTFRPNAPITRAEFAAIAARFSDRTDVYGKSFSDVKDSHWAKKYISMAQGLGWITGYPDGTFKPDKSITRAEAMTLINRVLERAVESEYYMCPNMVTWSDNKPSDWYYEDVQEATNSHLYHRTRNLVPGQTFYYEIWDSIEKNPDWAALEKTWSQATTR